MDILPEVLKQGSLGLLAGAFLWLYIQERKERKELQQTKDTLQEARRTDSIEMLEKVLGVTSTLGDVQKILTDKIRTVKRGE